MGTSATLVLTSSAPAYHYFGSSRVCWPKSMIAPRRSRKRSPPRREGFEGFIGKHQESLLQGSIPGIFQYSKPEGNPSNPMPWIFLQGGRSSRPGSSTASSGTRSPSAASPTTRSPGSTSCSPGVTLRPERNRLGSPAAERVHRTLSTVRRSMPNRRAVSRWLRPSSTTASRTSQYSTTPYISRPSPYTTRGDPWRIFAPPQPGYPVTSRGAFLQRLLQQSPSALSLENLASTR